MIILNDRYDCFTQSLRFIAILFEHYEMTWSDVAIFDKEKSTTSSLNASSFVTVEAIIMKTHGHITRTGV